MRNLTGILGLGISGLAAFELLRKQNKNVVVFDDKLKPNLKVKKYWKNYVNWDWSQLSRIIISPGIKISGENIKKKIISGVFIVVLNQLQKKYQKRSHNQQQ